METASADSMPEGVERQGIGTPATRATTIEKLVQKGFLERKGNKKTKVLLPTDKGKALITVMPEEIQSPEMTADWETKLLQIERGEMEPSEFMTEINTMITELVKNTEMKKGANKHQFEDGLRQVEPQLSDEELDELPISAVMDGKVQTFPDAAALDEALNAVPAGNFHITDDHLGEGGAKQKYARNIEAIRTLFKLEDEHRGATAEEQQVLSQYVGWGGLADAFAPDKDNWAKEYTVKEVRPRYSCFYKIRHPGDCDGQSGYGVSKLDSIVEEVVRQIFAQFREVSRKKLLESVKTNDAARIQKKVKKIQKDLESKQKELDDLKAETILVIRGVSALDKELLGTLVAEAREALETLEKQLVQAQEEYEEATKTAKRSNYICNELFTWADVYDTANHDERRAILQQFIAEIRVRKDYEISITLNASFNQVEQLKAVSTYDGAEIFEGISEKGA